jgi:DNA-binding transcriptional LysR family regulator
MLDPHRLGVFQSVMVTGSVQEAADNLRMTPSAVSQHIAALQRQTGLDLFDRVGRGIVPTAAAEALIAQAETVLQQWHRLDDYVADLRDGRTGRLVLGYFPSAGSTLLPSIVRQITAEFPDLVVELVLTEVGARSTIPDIDVAMDHTENTRRPGYRKVPLTEDPYILAVHHEHPLARRRAVTLTDLKGEGWVSNDSFANPGHRIVLAACAAKGFTPRFTVQAQDHHSALGFVAAGVGITVLPRLAARIIPDGVVRVRIPDPPVRQLVRRSSPRPARPAQPAPITPATGPAVVTVRRSWH